MTPMYDYKCDKCEKCFEELGSIRSDTQITKCPDCGADAQKQVVAIKSYTIKGDNSASTTPRRFL